MSEANKYEFKAEIKKLLHILSRSLYQHKEIFLREVISNSADALKKIHYIALQNKDILDADTELRIEVIVDKITNTLTIRDTGLGMTDEELKNNLGTIAGSGSQKFMEQLSSMEDSEKKEVDLDIIGQFGVGFYSVFMVAEKAKVISKSYVKDTPAFEWESEGSGEFEISTSDKASRGTEVVLYLRKEEMEFLDQYRIESIIKKYSNFVPFPIFVTEIKPEEPEVDVTDEIVDEEEDEGKESEKVDVKLEEGEGEEKSEEEPEEEVPEEPEEPQPVNEISPLWKRPITEITDEDYKKFYNYISRRYDDYLEVINYKVDGQVQFNSIVYIPSSKSQDLMRPEVEYGLDLYSKNILIMQNCDELLPQWLRFAKGVIDSEDISLNVSRDTIQSNRIIMKLEKLLVKRVINELNKLAMNDEEKFAKFWSEFGVFIKEGTISDAARREKLMDLIRVKTNKTKGNKMISLETYVKNMKEGQTDIFYLVGEDLNTLKISPHLGYYKQNDIEVILFDEAIDNFLMMNVPTYKLTLGEGEEAEDKSFMFKPIDVTEKEPEPEKKEGEEDKEEDKEKESKVPEKTQKFLDHIKTLLTGKIIDAKVSDRLYDTACRLANPAGGMTSSMQRAMRYWTLSNSGKDFQIPQKILEFNPEHDLVKGLIDLFEKDPENGKILPVVSQMFENCLLSEGDLPNPAAMVPRLNQILEMTITGASDVKNLADDLKEEDPAVEPEVEMKLETDVSKSEEQTSADDPKTEEKTE